MIDTGPETRPRQAVILAGGKGTRLMPLTANRPKAMVEIGGRPFLEYLIEMLRAQGFERVLILLGHLPEVIPAHFGDGARFGVAIDYAASPADDDTGTRLVKAAGALEARFLLIYCDNYWPMDLDLLWRAYTAGGAPAQITVYRNDDGWSTSTMAIDDAGFVTAYDKSRTAPGLSGVEIGFLILERGMLSMMPAGNVSLERELFPRLIAQRHLHAYVTDHRYYSIGSHARLPETARFLEFRKTVMLDRDGVLNRKPPRGQYITRWEEWRWQPGALEALRRLHGAGYRVVLVTNQAGVARGALSAAALDDIHARMCREVAAASGAIDAIYVCPHGWDDGCACRKPRPGMLFAAQRDLALDLGRLWYFGDDERDQVAAHAAGCLFAVIDDDTTLLDRVERLVHEEADRAA